MQAGSIGMGLRDGRLDGLQNQRINCEPQSRQFNHFTDMMLQSALSDDSDMCGQSLLCIVGRTPVHLLPPKALGLKQLLK